MGTMWENRRPASLGRRASSSLQKKTPSSSLLLERERERWKMEAEVPPHGFMPSHTMPSILCFVLKKPKEKQKDGREWNKWVIAHVPTCMPFSLLGPTPNLHFILNKLSVSPFSMLLPLYVLIIIKIWYWKW